MQVFFSQVLRNQFFSQERIPGNEFPLPPCQKHAGSSIFLNKSTHSFSNTQKQEEIKMLEIGTKAPSFSLPDQNGTIHTLEEYRGKKVILYFYPKDNTPGCTRQACNFGELYPQFQEKGAVILGVSKDSAASHKKFKEKYSLPFTLLSDPELSCIQAYDVWKEKKNYGRVSMGVVRTTYLIDEEGIILKAFGQVKAAENPAQMLACL